MSKDYWRTLIEVTNVLGEDDEDIDESSIHGALDAVADAGLRIGLSEGDLLKLMERALR